jgi:hypothetical protein
MTDQAKAAKAIKQELKKAFPKVKFSVKSESFSMGDAVRVNWEDGPTSDRVNAITAKYQYGTFNGMEDIYENSNDRDDIPQTKFVSLSRDMSLAANLMAIETIKEVDKIDIKFEIVDTWDGKSKRAKIQDDYLEDVSAYATQYVYQHLCKVDFCKIDDAVEIVLQKKENEKKLDVIFEEMDEMKVELFDSMDDLIKSNAVEPISNISVSCGSYSGVTYDFI